MVVRLGRYEKNLLRRYEERENRRRQALEEERKLAWVENAALFMTDLSNHISDRNLIHPVLIGYLGRNRNDSW